jgi:hypothetical protein
MVYRCRFDLQYRDPKYWYLIYEHFGTIYLLETCPGSSGKESPGETTRIYHLRVQKIDVSQVRCIAYLFNSRLKISTCASFRFCNGSLSRANFAVFLTYGRKFVFYPSKCQGILLT